ncbi:MAG: M14 family metallopeptidase [Gemmatimonadota bacterium]
MNATKRRNGMGKARAGAKTAVARFLGTGGLVLMVMLAGTAEPVVAQTGGSGMFAVPDRQPRVDLRFDRYYDHADLTDALERLEDAYGRFLTVESAGQSVEGRELWAVTINNPDTGPHTSKAAFYVDGNIHGNEIQGLEVNLYLIWFLMENYDHLPAVEELVDQRVFYIIPTMNPDGRQNFMDTGGPSRSGMAEWDSDLDGRANEDNPDDLDGDGEIRQMRKYVPGRGTLMESPVDPRLMVPAPEGEPGDYIYLGSEATDTDGDGRRAEDARGGYDMNRDFPSDWQPSHVQGGAYRYPFSWPETRAVGEWLKSHPNIAAAQSWHNSGGMILYGPGSRYYKGTGEYSEADAEIYEYLGTRGELMLPYYRYMNIWRDLYTVYGGTLDWAHDALGVISFTNELWSNNQFYSEAWDDEAPVPEEMQQLFFNDRLGMGAWFQDWTPVQHPTLGEVEVGGFSKWFGRTTPPFMLQELAHRNAMFAIFHADHMPLLEWGDIEVEQINGNTYRVNASVRNARVIPTRSDAARRYRAGVPDRFSVTGATVQAGGFATGDLGDRIDLVDGDPESLEVEEGVPSFGAVTGSWIVTGSGTLTLTYTSQKGGTLTTEVPLG